MNDLAYLFAYGTLQQPAVQRANFGRELDGYPDDLPGYRLEVTQIADANVVSLSGSAEHPIAVATGNPADSVAGTAFEVTIAELAAADRYEVDSYVRIAVELRSGRQAWVYVAA